MKIKKNWWLIECPWPRNSFLISFSICLCAIMLSVEKKFLADVGMNFIFFFWMSAKSERHRWRQKKGNKSSGCLLKNCSYETFMQVKYFIHYRCVELRCQSFKFRLSHNIMRSTQSSKAALKIVTSFAGFFLI